MPTFDLPTFLGAPYGAENIEEDTPLKDVVYKANGSEYKLQPWEKWKSLGDYSRLKERDFYSRLKSQHQQSLRLTRSNYNRVLNELKSKAGIQDGQAVTFRQAKKLVNLFERRLRLPEAGCQVTCDITAKDLLQARTGKSPNQIKEIFHSAVPSISKIKISSVDLKTQSCEVDFRNGQSSKDNGLKIVIEGSPIDSCVFYVGENGELNLHMLEVDAKCQGLGVASNLLKASAEIIDASDGRMNSISMHANLSAGNICWTGFGFFPDAERCLDILLTLKGHIQENEEVHDQNADATGEQSKLRERTGAAMFDEFAKQFDPVFKSIEDCFNDDCFDENGSYRVGGDVARDNRILTAYKNVKDLMLRLPPKSLKPATVDNQNSAQDTIISDFARLNNGIGARPPQPVRVGQLLLCIATEECGGYWSRIERGSENWTKLIDRCGYKPAEHV